MNLISHGSIDNKPEFRKFWEVFEEDKFEKKKKKKKDKEAKKKWSMWGFYCFERYIFISTNNSLNDLII